MHPEFSHKKTSLALHKKEDQRVAIFIGFVNIWIEIAKVR